MNEFLVTDLTTEQNLKKFLASKHVSSTAYKKLKMADCLLVNGQPVHQNLTLKNGDRVSLNLPSETTNIVPEKGPLKIIYEDDALLLVDKPAPLLTHPTVQCATGTLANLIAGYYVATKQQCGIHPISRLDRNTSGLVLFAKHSLYHHLVTQNTIKKEYLGIVQGVPTPSQGTITAPLARKYGSIIEREVNFDQGQNAQTNYEVLATNQKVSLVRFVLGTGRTHQIRVHCAFIGCPLWGDNLYGTKGPQARHLLHAFKLTLCKPFTDSLMTFTISLPNDMVSLMESEKLCYNNIIKKI
mgnify:CR=1 FL=1